MLNTGNISFNLDIKFKETFQLFLNLYICTLRFITATQLFSYLLFLFPYEGDNHVSFS